MIFVTLEKIKDPGFMNDKYSKKYL